MLYTLEYIKLISGWRIEMYIYLLLAGITIFFLLKWMLKNIFRVHSVLVRTILSSIATLIGVFIFSTEYNPGEVFNREDWMKEEQKRLPMATDMIRSKMLIGKDTNQVKQLLGNPAWRTDSTYQPGYRNVWVYDMGWGTAGLGFAWHLLNIRFDKTRVIDVDHGMQTD